jgi:hypothetical protein
MWYGKEEFDAATSNPAPLIEADERDALRARIRELEETVALLTAERDAMCEENAKITVLAEQLLETLGQR